jgi:nucleoid-associated protein YgaU
MRYGFLLILVLILGAPFAFAQSDFAEPSDSPDITFSDTADIVSPDADTADIASSDTSDVDSPDTPDAASPSITASEIPDTIRNNHFYLESLRLTELAQAAYGKGDYDASSEYAREAIRYAELSDEYVALQLIIKEAHDSIAAAKKRVDWAVSSGTDKQYPAEYEEARGHYEAGLSALAGEDWEGAIDSAYKVINVLAFTQPDGVLPARYTVRAWATSDDCLWNIAGRPWAYGDPYKWQIIYNANKSKFPEPDNPNLIVPGMVLDIPSISGETRQGMYSGR